LNEYLDGTADLFAEGVGDLFVMFERLIERN
jgi:hypothetical protein